MISVADRVYGHVHNRLLSRVRCRHLSSNTYDLVLHEGVRNLDTGELTWEGTVDRVVCEGVSQVVQEGIGSQNVH